jgi:hypothetical protein
MKEEMEILDIQDIFKDDANQIERTIDRIKGDGADHQFDVTQPQQQKHKPRDGQRPPKVIERQKGV